MKYNLSNTIQRLACAVVGASLAVVGLALTILGLTFLPVIGILVAIPIMALSLYFLNPEVEMIEADEIRVASAHENHESWCPWHPDLSRSFSNTQQENPA